RNETHVGQIHAGDFDLRRVLVEQVVELPLRELADRLVRVEEAAAAEDPAVPAFHAEARDLDRAFVERLVGVVERGQVEIRDRAAAFATRTHAAGDAEAAPLL